MHMKTEIKVPSMGESVTEATVSEILKKSGSFVGMDEEILELETDKVNQVIYSPQAGALSLSVGPDDVVSIGQVIGFIDASVSQDQASTIKQDASSASQEVKETPQENTNAHSASSTPGPSQNPTDNLRMDKASFIKQAQQVKTSHQSVANSANLQKPVERKPMSKIRKVIAKRLVEAKNSTAMLTTFNEVDLTDIMAYRKQVQDAFVAKYQTKLGFMSLFVKATVKALQEIPAVNAYIDQDDMVFLKYYDIGIAVGTDRGLMVPVVRDCDQLSYADIESTLKTYAEQARSGKISLESLQGGSFTITNGGVYGSLLSTPILNPPQSAILGMHAIQKRPVVKDNQIVIRDMMYLALSYDHRIIDGKEAVSFLVCIKEFLENVSQIDVGV